MKLITGMLAGATLAMAGFAAPAASAADPDKILRWVFPVAETGFDPAGISDYYSGTIIEAVFETLLTYDYLARPAKLVPLTVEALPQIADDGKTYTFKLRKGIHFSPDPAFKSGKRELVAEDYIYSLKRLIDPKIRSPYAFLVEGKFVGLDELAEQARKTGKFDYDAKIPGLEAVDKYTLRLRLKQVDHNLSYVLAFPETAAVAREVIEKYRDDSARVMSNPVGTGPYRLAKWVRGSKITLEANPEFRGFAWDFKPGNDPLDQQIVKEMKGKQMPAIGRIEIAIMEEDQSRWLAFQNNELDGMNMEGPMAPQALDGDKLKPELAKRGVKLSRVVDPEITYHYWLWSDPVVGGMAKEKIALRRALSMAYNVEEEIRVVRNGQAIAIQYPIPPGVVGHDPNYKSSVKYDPAAANALLDKFGYKKGADGLRTLPDGKPLSIKYSSRPDSLGRQQEEMWKKAFDSLSIRMESQKMQFPDLLKFEKQCQLQMRSAAWIADYPDGDNFMQLLYGPNSGKSNNSCTRIPEFDKLYEQSLKLPAGPERDRLYHEMTRIVEVYAPWRLNIARYRNMLLQPKVIGYRKHPILHVEWQYIDIDKKSGR